MRRTILAAVISSLLTAMLLAGSGMETKSSAQTTGTKSDLISKARQWANDCKKLDDDGQSIKNSWDQISSSINADNSDFTGTNGGLTKTQMTSVITTIGNMHTTYIAGNNTNVEVFR